MKQARRIAVTSSWKRSVLIIVLTLMLSGLGLLFVFESSVAESFTTFNDPYYLLKQQSVGMAAGIIAMFCSMFIPISVWKRLAPVMYVGCLLCLIAVFIPGIGLKLNGASRWLALGPVTVQPVEFFKFGLIAYFAQWLSRHQRFGPFTLLVGVPAAMLIAQPDLGSLLLVLAIATGMYFVAGGKIKHLAWLGLAGIPLIILAIAVAPYRLNRVRTFLNPELDPLGSSFHIRQITLALGRGGWLGQGLGNSQQRFSYIPEASTDSIFAIVAEEVGFVGSLAIILLFVALFQAVAAVVKRIEDPESRLLGYGLLFWLSAQTALNLSAVVALVPLTGVPLPFFSYGRSSLVMLLLAIGVIVRLDRESRTP